MISIYETKKTKYTKDGSLITAELRGLSTDGDKPTEIQGKEIDNGSQFIEIDTGKIYLYDYDSKTWGEI